MLKGQTIFLRTTIEEDFTDLHELMSNIANMGNYVKTEIRTKSDCIKQLKEHGWENDNGIMLILGYDNKIKGLVAFEKGVSYHNSYEIGYRIFNPEDWGKGYATEATSMFVSYLFDIKNVERLQATVTEGNEASKKVLQKCGFKYEGILRKAIFQKGKNKDLLMYSILRSEHTA